MILESIVHIFVKLPLITCRTKWEYFQIPRSHALEKVEGVHTSLWFPEPSCIPIKFSQFCLWARVQLSSMEPHKGFSSLWFSESNYIPIVMEGQEFRNVPVYRGGVKVPMKRPDFSQYNIFQFYPPGLCLRLGWYRVWCWSLRPWFVFEAFCVLCLCELRWQLFNLLNLRLTFQLFPQSWPSSSCSKRRESPSLPRRCLIQISNSKKNSMIYRWFHRIELFPTSG